MMKYIWGLVSVVGTVMISSLLLLLGSPVHSFAVWVFPLGAFILGLLSSLGYFIYLRKKRKWQVGDLVFVSFTSLLTFIAIFFIHYHATFISDHGFINYFGDGTHISDPSVVLMAGQQVDFFSFMNNLYSDRNFQHLIPVDQVLIVPALWVEVAGYVAGALAIPFLLSANVYKCKRCTTGYYSTTKLFDVLPEEYEKERAILHHLYQSNSSDLSSYLIEKQMSSDLRHSTNKVTIYNITCNTCNTRHLAARHYTTEKDAPPLKVELEQI
ncbi:hypothetical protein BpOF4_17645 [Alkalihalophilus pseudofirmus OF4]|uniref:Uncharacterized protein n=1 Tax=Alkalihalophilus pseudofirmus (strain ATCC BAA-2126 / JCM 17055 / OF4) TaxID=398511 RepID=D3FRH9_ALKPO|nr:MULTISPECIES: hypothetical protein [Alkalihalophilus]ADC51570.1 hypothetical protein BpOF4_17645 [Alkalihalophilus pseudofirmus OF4]MED1603358.1 hypothetical protein [Alkalihalophilus marmarensis]